MHTEFNPDDWPDWFHEALCRLYDDSFNPPGPEVLSHQHVDALYAQFLDGQTPRRALERLKLLPVAHLEPAPQPSWLARIAANDHVMNILTGAALGGAALVFVLGIITLVGQ